MASFQDKYNQQTVVNILFDYLVQNQKGIYICTRHMGFPQSDFNTKAKSQQAYRKFESIYKWFGFPKRYMLDSNTTGGIKGCSVRIVVQSCQREQISV